MNEIRDLSSVFHIYMPQEWVQIELRQAFALGVDFIAAQGTGTDWGPNWLGESSSHTLNRMQNKANARTLISTALRHKKPFIISMGTPTGSDLHLKEALSDVSDMARESGLSFRAAVIHGELDRDYLIRKLKSGIKMKRVVDSRHIPELLNIEDIEQAERIVGQMGPEPIIKALDAGVDGVITGRALDVALHMALPLKLGFDLGLAAHMAKTLECGGTALEDKDPGHFAWGALREDHFLVKSLNPNVKCTTRSVVGHALYERRDPFREENPGGYLDLTEAQFEQIDDWTVKVWGSKWVPVPYTVKLEGARLSGYRSTSIMGIREPTLIQQLDDFLRKSKQEVEKAHMLSSMQPGKDYQIVFRLYGKNGVLGELETSETIPREIGLVVEVVGKTQDLADDVLQLAYSRIAYGSYPGRITTAANVATPSSPHFFRTGPVYRFNVWHLLPLDDPSEPFRTEIVRFPFGS